MKNANELRLAMQLFTEGGKPSDPVIEIRLAGAVLHVMPGIDTTLLEDVLRAVRNSTPEPATSSLPAGFFGPRAQDPATDTGQVPLPRGWNRMLPDTNRRNS